MKRKTALFLVLLAGALFAQKSKNIVKIGCIDIQRVIDKVAGDRLLKSMLEDRKGQFVSKAEELAKGLNAKKELLTKEGSRMEADRAKALREEIAKMEEELKAFLQEKTEVLRQKEEALSLRVMQSIYDHMKEVAVKTGYSMIVDKSSAVLFVDPEVDITDEVIKTLDKEREAVLKGSKN